jgi:hypothetical protein
VQAINEIGEKVRGRWEESMEFLMPGVSYRIEDAE